MIEVRWEMDFVMSTGMEMEESLAMFAGATPAYMFEIPTTDSLRVDDLLDLTNHDLFFSSSSSSSTDPANDDAHHLTASHEFFSAAASISIDHSSDGINIPNEEAVELEWLSKFMEDSFSDSSHYYSFANRHMKENADFLASAIPAYGCSDAKKSKSAEISTTSSSSSSSPSSSSCDFSSKLKANGSNKKRQGNNDCGLRRCAHCSSEKTPQWRTGPLGPKTLCNACGVRFKSGRLEPEYRPAASPTFVITQHSNFHRKVMELRRQKEILILRGNESGGSGGVGGCGGGGSSGFSPEYAFLDYKVR